MPNSAPLITIVEIEFMHKLFRMDTLFFEGFLYSEYHHKLLEF